MDDMPDSERTIRCIYVYEKSAGYRAMRSAQETSDAISSGSGEDTSNESDSGPESDTRAA